MARWVLPVRQAHVRFLPWLGATNWELASVDFDDEHVGWRRCGAFEFRLKAPLVGCFALATDAVDDSAEIFRDGVRVVQRPTRGALAVDVVEREFEHASAVSSPSSGRSSILSTG